MSNPTIKVTTTTTADHGWHQVTVTIDGVAYEASAHVSGVDGTVEFGDSPDMWASDSLQERMGDDTGLMGRVQAAIEKAMNA